MSSASGLNRHQRIQARDIAVRAAVLGLRHARTIHYTQGINRWEGIRDGLVANHGRFPHNADCSAFATWCLWNALHQHFALPDIVNGAHWQAGYTGTLLNNGKQVRHESNILRADLAIYGHGAPGEHVAICIGGGLVISHGSEPGPFKLPLHYRPDLYQIRRYI